MSLERQNTPSRSSRWDGHRSCALRHFDDLLRQENGPSTGEPATKQTQDHVLRLSGCKLERAGAVLCSKTTDQFGRFCPQPPELLVNTNSKPAQRARALRGLPSSLSLLLLFFSVRVVLSCILAERSVTPTNPMDCALRSMRRGNQRRGTTLNYGDRRCQGWFLTLVHRTPRIL